MNIFHMLRPTTISNRWKDILVVKNRIKKSKTGQYGRAPSKNDRFIIRMKRAIFHFEKCSCVCVCVDITDVSAVLDRTSEALYELFSILLLLLSLNFYLTRCQRSFIGMDDTILLSIP